MFKTLILVLVVMLISQISVYADADKFSLFGVMLGEKNYDKRIKNKSNITGFSPTKLDVEPRQCSLGKLDCYVYYHIFIRDGFKVSVGFINPRFGGTVVSIHAKKKITTHNDRSPYIDLYKDKYGPYYEYRYTESNKSNGKFLLTGYKWVVYKNKISTTANLIFRWGDGFNDSENLDVVYSLSNDKQKELENMSDENTFSIISSRK